MKKISEYVDQVMNQSNMSHVKTVQFEIRVDEEGRVNQHGVNILRFNYTRPTVTKLVRDASTEERIVKDLEHINRENKEDLRGKRR